MIKLSKSSKSLPKWFSEFFTLLNQHHTHTEKLRTAGELLQVFGKESEGFH